MSDHTTSGQSIDNAHLTSADRVALISALDQLAASDGKPVRSFRDSPSVGDRVRFDFATANAFGDPQDPDALLEVRIYRVERAPAGESQFHLSSAIQKNALGGELEKARAAVSADTNNAVKIERYDRLLNDAERMGLRRHYGFTGAALVYSAGGIAQPAWTAATDDPEVEHVGTGLFEMTWDPVGQLPGDYFITSTWRMQVAGDIDGATELFSLRPAVELSVSSPRRRVHHQKYATLMNRYTAEMYRERMTEGDKTPEVIAGLNTAVGGGFAFVEAIINTMGDAIDANATPEPILPLLASNLGWNLRGPDVTRWRGQIKRAVPLYKMKGTLRGLSEALEHASMRLLSFTPLWQIEPAHSRAQVMAYPQGEVEPITFEIATAPVSPQDSDVLRVEWWDVDTQSWNLAVEGDDEHFQIQGQNLIWHGASAETTPVDLLAGAALRLTYQTVAFADEDTKGLELHVLGLPYADRRPPLDAWGLLIRPASNYTHRLIREDDPHFDVLVPLPHVYADPVVFGHIRTEFPYSEQAYAMDEYNGSKRPSTRPCDLDGQFVDTSVSAATAQYDVEVEVEDLSDTRMEEARAILDEFTPFHAILHRIQFTATAHDFVKPPLEELASLATLQFDEVVACNGQPQFNTNMNEAMRTRLHRSALASVTTTSYAGTGLVQQVVLRNHGGSMAGLPMSSDDSLNRLTVRAPSGAAGAYEVTKGGDDPQVSDASEPVGPEPFTFDLDTVSLSATAVGVTRVNEVVVTFPGMIDLDEVVSLDDVAADATHHPAAWTVTLASTGDTYDVRSRLRDGGLLLNISGTAPSAGTTLMTLTDDQGGDLLVDVVATVTTRPFAEADFSGQNVLGNGNLFTSASAGDLRRFVSAGSVASVGGQELAVVGIKVGTPNVVVIEGYTGTTQGGATVKVWRRHVSGGVGHFESRGMLLSSATDIEDVLEVADGENQVLGASYPEDAVRLRDLIVAIGQDHYQVTAIDGGELTLVGPDQETWTTAGVEDVDFDVLVLAPETVIVDDGGPIFKRLDRSGGIEDGPVTRLHEFLPVSGTGSVDFQGVSADASVPVEGLSMGMRPMAADGAAAAEVLNRRGSSAADSVSQEEEIAFDFEERP